MPFVRIDIAGDVSPERGQAIADAVHEGLVEAIAIPRDDRFQVVTHRAHGMIYDRGFLGIARSDTLVMIEIHLSAGRSLELKRALYRAIADRLFEVGHRREDVLIHLVETTLENWSFGNGIAQYADRRPAHLAAL